MISDVIKCLKTENTEEYATTLYFRHIFMYKDSDLTTKLLFELNKLYTESNIKTLFIIIITESDKEQTTQKSSVQL